MGKLVMGGVLLLISFFMMVARSGSAAPKASGILRLFALVFSSLGILLVLAALVVVIEPGQVGVRHAFGTVDPKPLLPGHSHRVALVVGGALLRPARSNSPRPVNRWRRSPPSPASRWA